MSTETTEKAMYYVWSKTENAGKVVQLDTSKQDGKWVYFTDGTKVNKGLMPEMLIQANSEEDANILSLDFGGIGGSAKDPEPVSVKETTQTKQVERRITDGKSEPTPEINIMMEMLKKMSKKNTATMPVNVNIPSMQVYEMLKDQMDVDSEELNEQIGLLVESQINNLKDQLKEQITSFITNYYKNDGTNTTNSPKQTPKKSDA